jgi:hypothetical protein
VLPGGLRGLILVEISHTSLRSYNAIVTLSVVFCILDRREEEKFGGYNDRTSSFKLLFEGHLHRSINHPFIYSSVFHLISGIPTCFTFPLIFLLHILILNMFSKISLVAFILASAVVAIPVLEDGGSTCRYVSKHPSLSNFPMLKY